LPVRGVQIQGKEIGEGNRMPHETILKFGYPQTLLYEYKHWVVLLRPKQVTVGSLVLACKEEAERIPDVSAEAFAELKTVTTDLETALQKAFLYDKINYLLLMMVDKQVHFHVLPRYAEARQVAGGTFTDSAWPGPPDVTQALDMTDKQLGELQSVLRSHWGK
jgi:diadenosine tetraphosphate (Ap4A) HIT family hydrolase